MPTRFEPPPIVRDEAVNLWVALMDSKGNPEQITAALDTAMAKTGPRLFGLAVATATTLFFQQSWPAVLAQLEAHGVTGDDVQTAIGAAMDRQIADYLRADVTPEEAQRGN